MAETLRTPSVTSRRRRWLALGMLSAALLVVMMDMTILVMALPKLVADLGSSATEQLWIVDAYSLLLAGLIIPMSALADRVGRRRILLLGFVLFGVVSVMVLFAGSSAYVIALRAALGIAGAMIMPTTLSMIRTLFTDPAERARALALWSLVAGLGAVAGPVIGGALLQFFDWHAAFLVNVPFVVAAIVGGLLLLPEAKDPDPPPWDLPATALSIAGMVAIVWGIKELGHAGWGDAAGWGAALGGLGLMALFVVRNLRRPDPMLEVRLFRSRPFAAGTLAALTTSLAAGGVLLLVAQWLQVVAGFTPIQAGFALLPMALSGLVSAPFAPALAERFGARIVLAGGLAVSAVGLLALGVLPLQTYGEFVVPLILVGGGQGSLAIGSAIIMGSTPVERAGNAAAIEESMYDVGNVLGVAVLGSVAAASYRAQLQIGDFVARGLSPEGAHAAEESIIGAQLTGEAAGMPDLVARAGDAFVQGLGQASLVGGLVLAAATIAVLALVPKGYDFVAEH